MLLFRQTVLSPMPCEQQKEESPETHQRKGRVCLFSSPSVVLCSEMAAVVPLPQTANPPSMGKCNEGLKQLILSQVFNPFFCCFVLISYSLTSHKFKLELHIQIILQNRSINHSMAPDLSKCLASFLLNLDFFYF